MALGEGGGGGGRNWACQSRSLVSGPCCSCGDMQKDLSALQDAFRRGTSVASKNTEIQVVPSSRSTHSAAYVYCCSSYHASTMQEGGGGGEQDGRNAPKQAGQAEEGEGGEGLRGAATPKGWLTRLV